MSLPALLFAAALQLPQADSLVVSTGWLAAHRTDRDLVVLHIAMDRAEYDKGHIPGARWVNPHEFFLSAAPGVELPPVERLDSVLEALGIREQSRIVFYGDTWMSPRVFLALDYLGLGDQASLLDGGFPAWREEQRPISTETPVWSPGRLTVRAHPEILADAAWIRAHLDNPSLLLIDGRSPGEYAGSDHSEQLPRFGHIPGGVNLPWEQTFTHSAAALDGTPSRLQPVDVLRRQLAAAGLTDGKALVTYCTVGLRASHLYFIARYLGWHPRIYDGSMSEWSRQPELPMANGAAPHPTP
jgi:thiosulfate/3-mercaptopyruvate sulfurtransferase